MRVLAIYLILFLSSQLCFSQLTKEDSLKILKQDFELDSLGELGLREKHYNQTKTGGALIDGQSILGKTRNDIINLIGLPNNSHTHIIGKRKNKKWQEELYYMIKDANRKSKTPGSGFEIILILVEGKVTEVDMVLFCG
jgi:hypothetical protein